MVQKNNKKNNEVKSFKVGSAWDRLDSKELKSLEKRCQEYLEFVDKCKTERATVAYVKEKALKAGFKEMPPFGKGF